MFRYSLTMLWAVIIFGSSLAAQTAGDLASSLDNWFEVDVPGVFSGTAPTLRPKAGGGNPFQVCAYGVRDDMAGIGGNSDITCTMPNGVVVRWVKVSTVWSRDDGILLCTGNDGNPGTNVYSEIIGEGSSIYVVGGAGAGAVSALGGSVDAINTATTTGGEAWAFAGACTVNCTIGQGGFGYAEAMVNGTAYAEGGAGAVGGTSAAGNSLAQAELDAVARGGSAGGGGGAGAYAYSATAAAYAFGGDSGTNGTYSVTAYGATYAEARAGDTASNTMPAGTAYAYANGTAFAVGGSNGGTDDGGDALAVSYADDALAVGGDSAGGNGGNATATAYGNASALGGLSFDTVAGFPVLGRNGGNGVATVVPGGTGDAVAQGGPGNIGGNATATMESTGLAWAIGGPGWIDAGNTNSQGGDATAVYKTAGGSATATSGSGSAVAGTGGTATATNDSVVPPQSNVFNPTNWQGGTVNAP